MKPSKISLLLATWLVSSALLQAEIKLFILPAGGKIQKVEVNSEIKVGKGDALIVEPSSSTGAKPQVITFEAFTIKPPKSLTLRAIPQSGSPSRDIKLPAPDYSETWKTYRQKVSSMPPNWNQFSLKFDLTEGNEIRIQNLKWRAEIPGEFQEAKAGKHSVATATLDAELSRTFPAEISSVEVGTKEIVIQGRTSATTSPLFLAEIPMDRLIDDANRFEEVVTISPEKDGSFRATVPRIRARSDRPYDRLVSRWRMVGGAPGKWEPLSHARYASKVACRSPDLPKSVIKGRKGLGGWNPARLPGELDRLGIEAVTVNLIVDSVIANPSSPDALPFEWQGKTYHASRRVLQRFDETFRKAAKSDAVVSLILLIRNPARGGAPSPIAHPGAAPEGTYAMPDVVSEKGISNYGAILNLLAERWSRPGFPNGRVHHWIIHNEVDAGWTWTNAGIIDALPFMDLYQRSMRLTDLIIRQYDPHARVFISLTHHWAKPGSPKFYGSRRMLEILSRFTSAEGDFSWALAHHPYPSNLRNPRTWEDKGVNFTFDTPKITPRNLEVLDAWMKRPEMLYHGKVRPVHLSENGFNSPDYSPKSFTDQAAGMAYAWKKMEPLSSIKVWHYHNWIDNRKEGGLRIGLRRFPDDAQKPLGPKPIWHLYKDLGTPREDPACNQYLETIGITDWSKIRFKDPIKGAK
ncbi:MAG: DUF5722 domain-containing protein [Akkermansiaceae bacterium]